MKISVRCKIKIEEFWEGVAGLETSCDVHGFLFTHYKILEWKTSLIEYF